MLTPTLNTQSKKNNAMNKKKTLVWKPKKHHCSPRLAQLKKDQQNQLQNQFEIDQKPQQELSTDNESQTSTRDNSIMQEEPETVVAEPVLTVE